MKYFLIFLIKSYQLTLSPDHGFLKKIGIINKPCCPFYPTCSEYSKQSIEKYGVLKGLNNSFKRIIRCYPGQTPQVDKP